MVVVFLFFVSVKNGTAINQLIMLHLHETYAQLKSKSGHELIFCLPIPPYYRPCPIVWPTACIMNLPVI